MRTGSLRGAPLAGLVSAYHAVHAGPCSVICVASARRKKLPTRKCGSAYRNCATCSQECCGADGTALNTCCIGPSGEDDINSEPCAATIASADQPCLHSIYNCSIKSLYARLPMTASLPCPMPCLILAEEHPSNHACGPRPNRPILVSSSHPQGVYMYIIAVVAEKGGVG